MSIAILGGLDRLKNSYEQKGNDLGYSVKVFSQRVPNLAQRLSGVNGIVIFTGTIAHHMVADANRVAKKIKFLSDGASPVAFRLLKGVFPIFLSRAAK